MEEHSDIYLGTYYWLRGAVSKRMAIPPDAVYPIWVSVTEESRILNSEGNVLLTLDVPSEQVFILDLEKWGYIVNYMYIPCDKADESDHEAMLKRYGIDDSTAYMSAFYPNIKQKIIRSWDRLFDDSIVFGPAQVGIIWEVRQEWISAIEQ